MVEQQQLLPKPGTKSVVWDYFGLEQDKNGRAIDDGTVICRTCRRRVVAKHGNTSNLLSHLRSNHSRLYSQAKDAMKAPRETASSCSSATPVGQPLLTECIEKGQKYDKKGKRWKELTQAVTYYIAKDGIPIHTVNKTGFKRLLNTFDRRYEIPSRNYFSETTLPVLYATVKEEIKQELSAVHHFSATTDLWSSVGMKPYMSYTVHFINEEWKPTNRCLQTQYVPDDHTGENLAEAMMLTLEAWELDVTKQVCLTTDNGSNIKNATQRLGWPRISCFGHNLHLSITKAVAHDHRCSRALGVCRKIVSAFSMSWKRKRDFTKSQINLGLPQHSLVAVRINYIIIIVFIIDIQLVQQ